MNRYLQTPITVAGILLTVAILHPTVGFAAEPAAQPTTASADSSAIGKMIAGWPERPRLGAQQMLVKYGAPQEATSEQLIWHNQGPFKRITVTKAEDNHDFPLPHMDYMEHTVDYKVPAEKADELTKFDGSATFDKTRGELSARCDLEGHNILTLNISNDILTGKKSAEEARTAFGKNVEDDMAGKYPPYTTGLQFEPTKMAKDSDTPSMPGAPKRAMKAEKDADPEVKDAAAGKGAAAGGDAEILSRVLAVNTNEIVAAMEAAKKKVSPEVLDYAKMLHTEHGKNAGDTMKLGQKIDVTPMDTESVNQLRIKGAGELAALVPLDGDKFGTAYIEAMIKGHTEVLAMIDSKLLPGAKNEDLKKHLSETRGHVAMHLEAAKKIQGGAKK